MLTELSVYTVTFLTSAYISIYIEIYGIHVRFYIGSKPSPTSIYSVYILMIFFITNVVLFEAKYIEALKILTISY